MSRNIEHLEWLLYRANELHRLRKSINYRRRRFQNPKRMISLVDELDVLLKDAITDEAVKSVKNNPKKPDDLR